MSIFERFLRSFGMHRWANRVAIRQTERKMLIAEHKKNSNIRPKKISFDEIMNDLSVSNPSRFLDRKVQSYISGDLWPPTGSDTFDEVEWRGLDNAFTTSVEGVKLYIVLGAPDLLDTIVLKLGTPVVANFAVDGEHRTVSARTAAMAMTMAYLSHQMSKHGAK
ncbi:hypothetical protein [Allomesorhizobium camelthorni]|uniref:Uncharacterized protein n=1 Tax=Allomesorhizobium camelthorni TaxID=475069 RepID=A0A6G4WP19_9HYPH|nr:hypothetical protein [Mesorhizobium camelthorni]NGO55850.1 hypothetical protein [Mesorhizobium camelthorni]